MLTQRADHFLTDDAWMLCRSLERAGYVNTPIWHAHEHARYEHSNPPGLIIVNASGAVRAHDDYSCQVLAALLDRKWSFTTKVYHAKKAKKAK